MPHRSSPPPDQPNHVLGSSPTSPTPAPHGEQPLSGPTFSERSGTLSGRHIVLCVTGSIAAFKAALVARLLIKAGATVQVVLTRRAEEFVGRATFSGITGTRCLADMFDPTLQGESHVTLAASSDLVLIVPATADLIARLVQGRADDTVAALALCARCPILIAPAMHAAMWSHPATQRNVAELEALGRVQRVGPVRGEVASGEIGEGRMAEPEQILAAVETCLSPPDLSGRHLVVTAGPTVEDLDPVRYLSNRSSGKMGFALARQAARRGARVTLIAGPVELATPPGTQRVDVRSALSMKSAVWQALGDDLSQAHALIMSAAVADYRPSREHTSKLRREAERITLELVANPDILAEVGQSRTGASPLLLGFALETGSNEATLASARSKLERKSVDLVVANRAEESLGREDNRATLVSRTQSLSLPRMEKAALANRILDWLVEQWRTLA